MRRLSLVTLVVSVGCVTPGRVATLERELAALKAAPPQRLADAPRLGGPDASEPVASTGAWVPAQAVRRTLLGAFSGSPFGSSGGGAVTLTTTQTISGAKTFSAAITSTVAGPGNALQLADGASICLTSGNGCFKWNSSFGVEFANSVNISSDNTSDLGRAASQWRNAYIGTSVVIATQKAMTGHGANNLAAEAASTAMTAGALAVTFGTAFTAAPSCTCAHVNTTNSNACVISVAPSTTAVTFAVASGATDVVNWQCIGQR